MADESIMEKVRKLLTLAERASTTGEAEAATAAAERLILKYGVDLALLQAARGDKGKPTTRTFNLPAPYAKPKALLLQVIAEANGCRAIWHGDSRSTVVGFTSDVETVELLFASMLLQAETACFRAQPRVPSRVRSFRSAFLLQYATTVGQRLKAARRDVEAEAAPGSALVLRDRSKDVAEAFAEQYPNVRSRTTSVSNHDGSRAGREAGNRADLGQRRMGNSSRAVTA